MSSQGAILDDVHLHGAGRCAKGICTIYISRDIAERNLRLRDSQLWFKMESLRMRNMGQIRVNRPAQRISNHKKPESSRNQMTSHGSVPQVPPP